MINYDEIDYNNLRQDLIDYFGTAASMFPQAIMQVIEVETASNEKLIQIALQNNFDINDYIKSNRKHR